MRKKWSVNIFFLAVFFLAAQGACADALDRLSRFLDSTRTLRAEFTQTITSKNGNPPRQSAGVMILSRPGKFRWETRTPYAQLLVGDGQKIWMYDPDLNQVTIKEASAALSGTPAALLADENRARLEKDFFLRNEAVGDGTLQWIEAKPKTQDGGFDRIRMGFSGNLPEIMEIYDNFGQVTALKFSNVEHNPAIDPSLLRFAPPDGADVIGE